MDRGYEDWDCFVRLMAAGWQAVTIPEILGDYRVRHDSMLRTFSVHASLTMQEQLLQPHGELLSNEAERLPVLAQGLLQSPLIDEVFALRAMVTRYRDLFFRPHRFLFWAVKKILRKSFY
jgi:hypothetical protein